MEASWLKLMLCMKVLDGEAVNDSCLKLPGKYAELESKVQLGKNIG